MKDYTLVIDKISDVAKERLLGAEASETPHSFDSVFGANACGRTYMSILKKYRITPDIMLMYTRLYLAFKDEPTACVFVINRQRRIKEVFRFARGYKARISNFKDRIINICSFNKTKRFVLAYNYNYKGTIFDELADLDKLYHQITKDGYTMIDCIKVQNGNATSLFLPYNNRGYK